MADSEKTEKSGKWRKFWNCYQQELFAVFLVFCVIALLDDRAGAKTALLVPIMIFASPDAMLR